jgi:CTP synthase (UTP-ammonia lyase)
VAGIPDQTSAFNCFGWTRTVTSSHHRVVQRRTSVIGIVGDRNPGYKGHLFTESALAHAPQALPFAWIATDHLAEGAATRLDGYDALFIAPGSPYRSTEGALAAIRHAREHGVPLLGTCGGFQHIVLEFVRNVLGIADADHAETNPVAPRLAVTPLSCSLAGQSRPVKVMRDTKAAEIYGADTVIEPFFCNFGLNPDYIPRLEAHGLRISGVGEEGTVRILELRDHPFFMGTLFVPQARSTAQEPHPLVAAFVAAARRTAM